MVQRSKLPGARQGVGLPLGATDELHAILRKQQIRGEISPSAEDFRRHFRTEIPLFERNRRKTSDSDSLRIAVDVVRAIRDRFQYYHNDQGVPLREHMRSPCQSIRLREREYSGLASPKLRIPYRGRDFNGSEIRELADTVHFHASMTAGARDALQRIDNLPEYSGIAGMLQGQKIVVMGGDAETSPVTTFLKAGAQVLSLVRTDSPRILDSAEHGEFSGVLNYVEGGVDLLADPTRARDAIIEFAGNDPVHLLMLAYAPGQNREWYLMGAQNAIMESVPPGMVRTVGTFLSPSIPALVTREDYEIASRRELFGSQSLLKPFISDQWREALYEAGHISEGDVHIANAVEEGQGTSYQGGQYIGKMLQAEVLAAFGFNGRPVTVSANVMGITRTGSMDRLVYRFGFAGAAAMGLDIFESDFTANVGGLLFMHDLLKLNRDVVGPNDVFSKQVHGGIYNRRESLRANFLWARWYGIPHLPRVLIGG